MNILLTICDNMLYCNQRQEENHLINNLPMTNNTCMHCGYEVFNNGTYNHKELFDCFDCGIVFTDGSQGPELVPCEFETDMEYINYYWKEGIRYPMYIIIIEIDNGIAYTDNNNIFEIKKEEEAEYITTTIDNELLKVFAYTG